MTAPEARCVVCGCPAVDHVPLRYVWRAWWRHRLYSTHGVFRGRV